jgi:hypothetical protein
LIEKTEVVPALLLEVGQVCFKLYAQILIILLNISLVISMDPEKELILDVLLEGFEGNTVPRGQAQHHCYFSFLQPLLLLYDSPAAPLIEIIVKRRDSDLHQPHSMNESSQLLILGKALKLGDVHSVP